MRKIAGHDETVPFGLVIWIIGLFLLFAAFFFGLLVFRIVSGTDGSDTEANGAFVLMTLIFAGSAGLLFNFRRLRIHIDDGGFRAAYGIFRQEYTWENVKSAAKDRASVFRYGGWGIRYTRAEGCWRRAYTVINTPRVTLTLRQGLFRQFAFSTNKPEEVLTVVEGYLREKAEEISR